MTRRSRLVCDSEIRRLDFQPGLVDVSAHLLLEVLELLLVFQADFLPDITLGSTILVYLFHARIKIRHALVHGCHVFHAHQWAVAGDDGLCGELLQDSQCLHPFFYFGITKIGRGGIDQHIASNQYLVVG